MHRVFLHECKRPIYHFVPSGLSVMTSSQQEAIICCRPAESQRFALLLAACGCTSQSSLVVSPIVCISLDSSTDLLFAWLDTRRWHAHNVTPRTNKVPRAVAAGGSKKSDWSFLNLTDRRLVYLYL